MSSRIKISHVFIYSLMNWIIICVAYPIVVKPDSFIGIVYFFGLIITIISFIGIVCTNEFILKRTIVKDNHYYLTFFLFVFIANQLSYLCISRPIPIFDLNDTFNEYYKGENMLFTLSSIVSSILVFGIIYIKKIKKEKSIEAKGNFDKK